MAAEIIKITAPPHIRRAALAAIAERSSHAYNAATRAAIARLIPCCDNCEMYAKKQGSTVKSCIVGGYERDSAPDSVCVAWGIGYDAFSRKVERPRRGRAPRPP